MMSRRTVVDVKVEDVEKRRIPSKHYVYLISVTWSDGTKQLVFRRYSKFFDLQMQLLDQFPMEGGQRDPKLRTIPFLPGKILFRRSHIRDVAVKRLKPINEYCQALVRLPAHISQCPDVLRFFETRQEDLDAHKGFMEKKKNGRDTSWDRDGEADGEEQCIAVADYERQQAGEIGLRAGQSVDVLEKSETGWWFVSGIDEQGWVPASFLEPHKEIRDSPPSRKPTDVAKRRRPHLKRLDRRWTLGGFTNRQPSRAEVRCIALQPYTAQDKDELGFEKGTSLDVLQQNTEGWWLVRHQGRQGWAPAHCLQRVLEDHTTRRKTALPPVEIVGTMMDVSNLPGRPWARRGSGGSGGSEPGCRLAGSVSGSSRSPNLAEKTRHTSATEHERKTPSSPAVARIAPQRPSNGSPERSPGGSPRRDASLQARGLRLPKPPAPPSVEMEYYTIAEFQTTISDGISFRGGQKVEVIEKCVSGWWYVQIGHDEGWAPASYIEKRKKVNLVRRTSNVTRPKVPPPAPPGRTRASSADGRHSNDRARGRETEANGRSPSTVREHIYDVPAVDCPDVITTIRSTRGNGSPRAVTKHTACTARSESPGSPRPVTATVSPSVISAQSRTTLTRGNPVLLSPRSTPRASVRPRLDSDGSETREDIGRDGCRDVTGRATLPRSNAQSVSEEMYEGSACLTQGRGVKPSLRPKPVTNYITSNPGGSPGRLDVGTVSRGINEAGPGSEKKEGVSEEIVNGIRTLGEIGSRTSAQSSQASGGKNGTRHLELSGKGEPYRAVARFEKVQNSELSLNEGDMVDVLEKKDGGWWFVRSGVDEGWVPASYLETRMSITSTGSISRIGLGSQVQKTNINGTDSDRWHSQDNSLPPKRPPPPKLSPSMGRHGGRRLPAPIEKSIRMENLESYSGARCHASPSSRILEKVKTLPAANNRASSSTDMNGAQRSSPRLSRRDPREVVAGTRRATQMHQTSSGGSSPRERSDVSTMENGTLSLGRSRSDRLQSRTFLGQALRAELISRPMPHSGDVYVAIADYAGDDETLGFDEGVSLEVIERHPNGWWYCKLLDGRCEDSEGWAPSNYLERKVLLGGCSIHTRYGEDSKKE